MNGTQGNLIKSSDRFNYSISIQTGIQPRKCRTAAIDCFLRGANEDLTKVKLNAQFSDDSTTGQTDTLVLSNQPFSSVDSIEVVLDSMDDLHEWYIDTILVHNTTTETHTVFPVSRWLRPEFRYTFTPAVTCLPHHDKQKDKRQTDLVNKRKKYQLEQLAPGIPPVVKHLPWNEQNPFVQKVRFVLYLLMVALERQVVWIATKAWKSLADIRNVYTNRQLTEPADTRRWEDDVAFGFQRIAGVNNCFIKLCKKIPEKLNVTDKLIRPFLEGKSLTNALVNRCIFIVDYAILKDCPPGPNAVLVAPIALFYQRNDGLLVPVAIQLYQDAAENNPVFLPSDPKYTWILAKMWFNNADSCIHQSIAHFGFTHLLMEGIAVITHRYLSESHPLFKLMVNHFFEVMYTSRVALQTIMNPGGIADQFLSCGAIGAFELIRRHKPTWRMNVEGTLPEDLKNRCVDDLNILPHYNFRDDALLLYDCIKTYVTDYTSLYYVTDDDILKDKELQFWRAEMVKPEAEAGLGILGVAGEDGKFTTTEQVIEVVTSVIFTCSVSHAAANFKQYDEYAHTPNYPAKLNGYPPRSKSPLTEKDVLAALPDKQMALNAMVIEKILSRNVNKSLGDFDVNYIFDPKGLEVVKNFRDNLKVAGDIIRERNKSRNPQYTYLDPSEVPNSPGV